MTDLLRLTTEFLRDDGGSPLGPGMPSGSPLRSDGQSHYEAWQALLRRDACSYCGAQGAGGTVDHVDPRSGAARGLGSVHAGSTPWGRACAATTVAAGTPRR